MAELAYPGLHPNDPQNNPSDPVGRKIRSRLKQEVHSQRLEKKLEWVECCRKAYDIYVEELLGGKESLDDSFLEDFIPQLVFRAALEFGWMSLDCLHSPPVKKAESPGGIVLPPRGERSNAWLDRSRTENWFGRFHQTVPSELKPPERWACLELRNGTAAWVKRLLGGRIEYWQGAMLETGSAEGLDHRRRTRAGSLKSRRGRPKGSGSTETKALDAAIRDAKRDGEKTSRGILEFLARRAGQIRVPLPGGWHDKYNVKSWKEVRFKTATDAHLLELCGRRFSKVKA